MNVTVLLVCTVLLRVDVSGEFSRFFSVFCIIKYLLRMQCKYNVSLWNKDLALVISSTCATRTKIELKLPLVPKKLYSVKLKLLKN